MCVAPMSKMGWTHPQALTSFSELPSQMMGRPILYRQVGYRFYRPAAFAVAAVLSDIPYNASNIVSAARCGLNGR